MCGAQTMRIDWIPNSCLSSNFVVSFSASVLSRCVLCPQDIRPSQSNVRNLGQYYCTDCHQCNLWVISFHISSSCFSYALSKKIISSLCHCDTLHCSYIDMFLYKSPCPRFLKSMSEFNKTRQCNDHFANF